MHVSEEKSKELTEKYGGTENKSEGDLPLPEHNEYVRCIEDSGAIYCLKPDGTWVLDSYI